MSQKLLYRTRCAFLVILLFYSCMKEHSCEGCISGNKPPVALAGLGATITLPADSVLLDGSASLDIDGKITGYKWTKISGPASSYINTPDSSMTMVRALVMGVYVFELTVQDNGGLTSKDTVKLMVDNPAINQPPLACAGVDQVIVLPINSLILDGTCSTDPDNNITDYQWTKVAGPTSFTIVNSNVAKTQVGNMVEGTYQFELKITDASLLTSKDTLTVIVNAAVVAFTCNDTNRPHINAKLIEVGTLSIPRWGMAVASSGDKILFAGGAAVNWGGEMYSRVDIYDLTTKSWSTSELSSSRWSIASVAVGDKIFFAGGDGSDGAWPEDNIDIYDVSTNSWSLMHLSSRNEEMTAAVVGSKVLFLGGAYPTGIVDIFDLNTNSWSNDSINMNIMASAPAITVQNKVYFGGNCNDGIIIYDNNTHTWSSRSLNESRMAIAGINVGNKIFWAGGKNCDLNTNNVFCSVEIQDLNSGNITTQNLSAPKGFWTVGGQNAAVKDSKIIFCKSSMSTNNVNSSGVGKFDIYDIITNTWSIGVFPVPLEDASIISVNNTVYLAGGFVNGVLSNKVWKLEF